MNKKPRLLAATTLVLAISPTAAFAHPTIFHTTPLMAGLAHPLSGLDHILAMVAVGMWAAQRGGRALWAFPAAFIGIMIVSGVAGMAGFALPMVEPGIAASVLVLGLLVASAAPLPVWAGSAAIAVFAAFHGNAHGLEAGHLHNAGLYALGFAVSTAALHAIGIGAGLATRSARMETALRAGGAGIALAGATLFFA